MRNLLQYPITKEEIVTTICAFGVKAHSEEKIGDCRPTIAEGAARFIMERLTSEDLKEFFGI